MNAAEAFRWCEAEVRRVDYDRYLSALFVRGPARAHLLALYAFNYEIAKIAETVREPLAGHIRLQWWRETVEELYAGKLRRHETVVALAEVLRARDLPKTLFDTLIDAREHDSEEQPFADMAALESYADATSGNFMRLAARILGADAVLDDHAREAGIAYALAGLLRALPFRAARRRSMLPKALLVEVGLNAEDLFAGQNSPVLKRVINTLASVAITHLNAAHAMPRAKAALPALLPAALCPLYLRVVTREGFNPFRDVTDVTIFRRQFTMLVANLRGRI